MDKFVLTKVNKDFDRGIVTAVYQTTSGVKVMITSNLKSSNPNFKFEIRGLSKEQYKGITFENYAEFVERLARSVRKVSKN